MKCVSENSGAVQGNKQPEEACCGKIKVLRTRQVNIKCLIAARMVQPNCSQQHECIYSESANFQPLFHQSQYVLVAIENQKESVNVCKGYVDARQTTALNRIKGY
jgi:hypothetical protein